MLTTNGVIDWDSVIKDILENPGSLRHIDQTIDNSKTNLQTYNDLIRENKLPYEYARTPFVIMVKDWYQAGYNFKNITFQNYYPGEHFSVDIVEKFENIIGLSAQECWISRVSPFSSVPFHSDEYDKEITWVSKENKKLSRYMVFIDKPVEKQIFVVGNAYYENVSQHTVIKWNSTKDIHALINCSNRDNLLFHFLGFKND